MSSYETAVEEVKKTHRANDYPFTIKFTDPFYNNPSYIDALAASMQPYLETGYDHLLFSYHGVPGRHIRKSDITGCHCLEANNCCTVASPAHAYCYRHQCFTTTRLVTERLGVPANKFSISFQSRLGKGWLEPLRMCG
jgi:protoporphyrin/coproporphyrin ferrochelatase